MSLMWTGSKKPRVDFMNFNNFIGNNTVKYQLQNMFVKNKIPHAILLEGARGLGKRTFANIIAQTAVCTNLSNGLACGNCSNCHKAQKNIHSDIIYPEKSGALQTFNISTIRQIRADAYVAPNEAARKVYIFTDVDNMGVPAQNAILKVLEEPPKNVVFIFTCVAPSNLLQTVRSRLQQFSLKPVSKTDMLEYLQKTFTENDIENLNATINISSGNIGSAIELLTSSDLENVANLAEKIAYAIASPREFELISAVSQVAEERKNFFKVLTFLEPILKEALFLSQGVNLTKSGIAQLLAQKVSTKQILNLIEVVAQTKKYIDKNVNPSILSAFFCSSLYENSFCT